MSRLLPNGAKARQREDTEDRSIPFGNALRKHRIPATDMDWVITNGGNRLRLLIEITCPDERVYSPERYLASIDARRRDKSHGNRNDDITLNIAQKLGVTAILVVYQPDVEEDDSPLWWRFVNKDGEWHTTTSKEFFDRVRRYALR